MRYRLMLRGDYLKKIKSYFFPLPQTESSEPERFVVIFLATAKTSRLTTLLPAELWLPQPEDYQCQNQINVIMTGDFVYRYYNHCCKYNYSLMTLHSHPFDANRDNFFSGIDDSSDVGQRHHFKYLVPDGCFIAGVMNKSKNIKFRLFETGEPHERGRTPDEILHIDIPLRKEFYPATKTNQPEGEIDGNVIFDRQIRVFGRDGQKLMGALRVCIVGVGGLGSVLVEILARLGVKDFTLIDHDRAEWTNLNRFAGMYQNDVQHSRAKVKIARRLIRKINPEAKIRCIVSEIYAKRAVNVMKEDDIVFLCTDNATSRDFVNKFSLQYLMPLISLGSIIEFNQKLKRITGVLGEVIVMIPGAPQNKFCLVCSGAINTDLLKMENSSGFLADRLSGYIHGDDEPAPAVRYLNGLVADFAAAEFHNLVCNFKDYQPYQHINLMPSKRHADDFDEEDFNNFLGYLSEEGIVSELTDDLKGKILDDLTILNDDGTIRSLNKDIFVAAFTDVVRCFQQAGALLPEKERLFMDEIIQYFTPEILNENAIVSLMNTDKEVDDCYLCGQKAMLMGQGDFVELKKFSI